MLSLVKSQKKTSLLNVQMLFFGIFRNKNRHSLYLCVRRSIWIYMQREIASYDHSSFWRDWFQQGTVTAALHELTDICYADGEMCCILSSTVHYRPRERVEPGRVTDESVEGASRDARRGCHFYCFPQKHRSGHLLLII